MTFLILDELRLIDLQPSQFYISAQKLQQIKTWFRPDDLSNFVPIPVQVLSGKIIITDGHTRAVAALSMGLSAFRWFGIKMN